MKTSPLQLNWVSYPSASFEQIPGSDHSGAIIPVDILAKVAYRRAGEHYAMMEMKSKDGVDTSLRFSVSIFASFNFNLEVAMKSYSVATENLPGIVAANVSRILYAGGREMIAIMTARSPSGSAMVDSVLIEPADVSIESDEAYEVIMKDVFGYDSEVSNTI